MREPQQKFEMPHLVENNPNYDRELIHHRIIPNLSSYIDNTS
jgi:hypothetical protein